MFYKNVWQKIRKFITLLHIVKLSNDYQKSEKRATENKINIKK